MIEMKKLIVSVLTVVLVVVLLSYPALAAGKLTVAQEKFIVTPYISYHAGEVYAEVENTGDRAVEYAGGLLELFDQEGDTIEAEEPRYCYPPILEPGEKGYIYVTKSVKEATDRSFIDDYLLTVTGKGAKENTIRRYPTEGRYEVVEGGWSPYHYSVATVTNDSDVVVYGYYAVFAAKDSEGNLLYASACDPSYVGIVPGSTVEIRMLIDNDVIEYYESQGVSIASIDAIVYKNQK